MVLLRFYLLWNYLHHHTISSIIAAFCVCVCAIYSEVMAICHGGSFGSMAPAPFLEIWRWLRQCSPQLQMHEKRLQLNENPISPGVTWCQLCNKRPTAKNGRFKHLADVLGQNKEWQREKKAESRARWLWTIPSWSCLKETLSTYRPLKSLWTPEIQTTLISKRFR